MSEMPPTDRALLTAVAVTVYKALVAIEHSPFAAIALSPEQATQISDERRTLEARLIAARISIR